MNRLDSRFRGNDNLGLLQLAQLSIIMPCIDILILYTFTSVNEITIAKVQYSYIYVSNEEPPMTEIEGQKAESWTHLMELLYADSWVPGLNRYRSPFAFRGVADASWSLETSLIRLGGPIDLLERHLLRNFRKYAYSHVKERDSLWFWLTFAQHHGLPTRLLDWTYSPYVALHFATDNLRHYDRDGVVWMTDFVELHKFLPSILSGALDLEGSNVFTTEMLTRFEKPEIEMSLSVLVASVKKKFGGTKTIRTLQDFDRLHENDFLLFFEPPSIDDRVVNQFALFSVLSNPKLIVDQWLASHKEHVRRIIIPKELKPEVRDKLDQANITERVLFPGLDGLSRWLRRHYSTYPNA